MHSQGGRLLPPSKRKTKKSNNPTKTSAVLVRKLADDSLVDPKAVAASLETQKFKQTQKLLQQEDDSDFESGSSSWES